MEQTQLRGNAVALWPRYEVVLTEICQLFKAAGYELSPFNPSGTSRFPVLSESQQSAIVNGLEGYLNLCVSAHKDGAELRGDSQPAAWWAIRSMGLRPLSDVFSHIQEGDTIEIYNASQIQVFRSFNMIRCLSYSLDEVSTYEWWELYRRDSNITDKMLSVGNDLVTGKINSTVLNPWPHHSVSEVFGPYRKTAAIQPRLVSPLFDLVGKAAGFINVFKIESIIEN